MLVDTGISNPLVAFESTVRVPSAAGAAFLVPGLPHEPFAPLVAGLAVSGAGVALSWTVWRRPLWELVGSYSFSRIRLASPAARLTQE